MTISPIAGAMDISDTCLKRKSEMKSLGCESVPKTLDMKSCCVEMNGERKCSKPFKDNEDGVKISKQLLILIAYKSFDPDRLSHPFDIEDVLKSNLKKSCENMKTQAYCARVRDIPSMTDAFEIACARTDFLSIEQAPLAPSKGSGQVTK